MTFVPHCVTSNTDISPLIPGTVQVAVAVPGSGVMFLHEPQHHPQGCVLGLCPDLHQGPTPLLLAEVVGLLPGEGGGGVEQEAAQAGQAGVIPGAGTGNGGTEGVPWAWLVYGARGVYRAGGLQRAGSREGGEDTKVEQHHGGTEFRLQLN